MNFIIGLLVGIVATAAFMKWALPWLKRKVDIDFDPEQEERL